MVSVTDSTGKSTPAPLIFVSPGQVTFLVPQVATGNAKVVVTDGGITETAANIQIAPVAPGLFTINGSSLAAAYAVRVSNGTQIIEPAYVLNSTGSSFSATPINMGSGSDQVYLTLYGTGLSAAGMANITVTVNGVNAPVLYAGPQGSVMGLDQLNVQLPASLAGSGNVNVQLTASGIAANQVQITIQ
jgi:uncharacterized protein (TIGR03437 family)